MKEYKPKFIEQTEIPPPSDFRSSETNDPVLFHYTSHQNLLSIAQTKMLWATNIHFLNDSEEFKNALAITRNCIGEAKKGKDPKTSKFLDNLMAKIDTIAELNIHIISFTANGDLLSQWRAYCSSGGVSVGFKYNDLLTLAIKNSFSLRKCIYDDHQKKEIIHEVINLHLEFFKKLESEEILFNGFIGLLAKIAPCFKHQAFHEEQEWRLISEPISVEDKNIGIRIKGNLMYPYYKFSLEGLPDRNARKNLSFDRFIISQPTAHNLSRIAFGYFLNSHQLSYKYISFSQIPYRTL